MKILKVLKKIIYNILYLNRVLYFVPYDRNLIYRFKVDKIDIDSIGTLWLYSNTQEILDTKGKFIKDNNRQQAYSKHYVIKDLETAKIKANLNF